MPDLSKLLVDTMSFHCQVLEESSQVPGAKYIARGEFARSDRATENKRLYTRSLWEREIGRLGNQLRENKVYGELDHPMDGRTQLKRASHIVTDLHLEGDVVVGTAHIMDTSNGRELKAILDAGGSVGVSSRGFGTTKPNLKGEDVVQDDYKLMTFDFVAEPAMSSAYPKVSTESRGEDTSTENAFVESPSAEAAMDENMTLEQLKESHPELAESFMADAEREYEKKAAEIWAKKISGAKDEAATNLRGEFAEKLEAALAEARKEIEESVRERLLKDPMVAGAKTALDEVKDILRPYILPEDAEAIVREREEHIETLKQQIAEVELEKANLVVENQKLAAIAKEAGYRYHLEHRLHEMANADHIRGLVGDVKNYKSIAEMDGRIVELNEELEKRQLEESVKSQEVARLEAEVERQKLIAEKALAASKELATQVYVEQRLANHPDAEQARALVEASAPQTKEEVDGLIRKTIKRPSMTEDMENTRARVRQLLNSPTQEYLQEEVEGPQNGSNGTAPNYNGLGTNVEEIRALSGMSEKAPSGN